MHLLNQVTTRLKNKVFRNCIGFEFTISVIQYTVYNYVNDIS